MDKNEKKDYLRGYKALVLRIKRLMNMKEINPEKRKNMKRK